MNGRTYFAYVVGIDGSRITLNMHERHKGQVVGHVGGVSSIGQPGDIFGVAGGPDILVLRLLSLQFSEPKEAHLKGVGTDTLVAEPLRYLVAVVVGWIEARDGVTVFTSGSTKTPALGAGAFPLASHELETIFHERETGPDNKVILGTDARTRQADIVVGIDSLLKQHVVVLGSTGQGKSCYTAAIIQQLLEKPSPRIVVMDINGEYHKAFQNARGIEHNEYLRTVLGHPGPVQPATGYFRIPYFAFGRHGLGRMLLPSEKTQRPALAFAIENLPFVECQGAGARLVNDENDSLFDDCREMDAASAAKAIEKIREGKAASSRRWPHMKALAILAAEGYCLKQDRGVWKRDAFNYGHVAPLITRINRLIEDPQFTSIVDVRGTEGDEGNSTLNWEAEGRHVISDLFGASGDAGWKIHVVDLSKAAHDLLPIILGSLLELLAFELFRRGPGGTHPTLLVLEEAHQYLRQLPGDAEIGMQNLAYERLAKEGRKFGVSLWLSTQRPSELSSTVLAQCGTWVVFRLTNETDLRSVRAASEWFDQRLIEQIPGLPRQEALVFGSGIPVATRIIAPDANPLPESRDPEFSSRWAT